MFAKNKTRTKQNKNKNKTDLNSDKQNKTRAGPNKSITRNKILQEPQITGQVHFQIRPRSICGLINARAPCMEFARAPRARPPAARLDRARPRPRRAGTCPGPGPGPGLEIYRAVT